MGDGDSCIHAQQFTDSIELAQRAQQESIISPPKQTRACREKTVDLVNNQTRKQHFLVRKGSKILTQESTRGTGRCCKGELEGQLFFMQMASSSERLRACFLHNVSGHVATRWNTPTVHNLTSFAAKKHTHTETKL